ncbi:hypothetical protein KC865_01175 [Candidatus Kaiserbacteria bacterium]|nr:hypothetical protein [Candidatus Kaiserbacteria bacterium]
MTIAKEYLKWALWGMVVYSVAMLILPPLLQANPAYLGNLFNYNVIGFSPFSEYVAAPFIYVLLPLEAGQVVYNGIQFIVYVLYIKVLVDVFTYTHSRLNKIQTTTDV